MNHPHMIVRSEDAGIPASLVAQTETDAPDKLDLRAVLTTLQRRILLFFIVFATVLCMAAYLTIKQPTLYVAAAEMVLNMRQDQIVPNETSSAAALTPADRADTEVEVLKSRDLAERVADALELDRDPTFNPALSAPPRSSWFRNLLGGSDEPARAPTRAEMRRMVIDILGNSLSVERLGQTYAMQVSVTTGSPINAARIANEYVRQYTQGQQQDKVKRSNVAAKFLEKRLEELRVQAQADTANVQRYRIANNLLSTSGASLTEQEIAAYNQAVTSARAQNSEDLARLSTARSQLLRGSSGEDVGEALGSSVISSMRSKQAEVSGRLALLRARYQPIHPEVRRVAKELEDIDEQIQAEIKRVISNLDARAHVSRERLGSIAGSLETARGKLAQNNAAMTGLDDLQRRAQSSQSLYESYLNRYKEAVAEGGTERPDASVISRAQVPLAPTSPRPKLNMMLGGVLGVGAGLAAAFLAEMLFSGLTTGSEAEQRLGLAYLGGVPLLSSLRGRSGQADEAVVSAPRSSFAEAFRTVLTSIRQVCLGTPRVLLVTSALPREGKTTIAICLARTISRQNGGGRTLLIDGDFSQPETSRKLVPDGARIGLLDVLNGNALLDDALVRDTVTDMDILPVVDQPAEDLDVMAGPAMQTLLDELRKRYACIVIDTAPVLPVATTRELAAMADTVVFVVRWRHTPDHAITAALRLLRSQRAKIAGVVLSRIDMRRQVRVGHGDPTYYFPKYKKYYSW